MDSLAMAQELTWTDPSSLSSPYKKRLSDADWAPYKSIILELRGKKHTAREINEALRKEGFLVNLSSLDRKLRKWMPKNRKENALRFLKVGSAKTKPVGPVAGSSMVLDPSLGLIEVPSMFGTETLAPVVLGQEISSRSRPPTVSSGEVEEKATGSTEELVAKILLDILAHEGGDGELRFHLDITNMDECDEETVGARMLSQLTLGQRGNLFSTNALEAPSSSILPTGKSGPEREGIDMPIQRISDSERPTETRYSIEELLEIVEDMPRWWPGDKPKFPPISSASGLHDHGDFERDMRKDLEQRLAAVSLETRDELESVLLAIKEDIQHEWRNPGLPLAEKAIAGISMLSQPEFAGLPQYFSGYLMWLVSTCLSKSSTLLEAGRLLRQAQSIFAACDDIPPWARAVWIQTRMDTLDLEFMLPDHNITQVIRCAEMLLYDIEVDGVDPQIGAQLFVIHRLSLFHSMKGDYRYIKVLERLVALVQSIFGKENDNLRHLLEGLAVAYNSSDQLEKRISLLARYFHGKQVVDDDLTLLEFLATSLLDKRIRNTKSLVTARMIYQFILSREAQRHPPTSPDILQPLQKLAQVLALEGQYRDALVISKRILDSFLLDRQEEEAAARDPWYTRLYLGTKTLAAVLLLRRVSIIYRELQPIFDDIYDRLIEYYGTDLNPGTWEAQRIKGLLLSKFGNQAELSLGRITEC